MVYLGIDPGMSGGLAVIGNGEVSLVSIGNCTEKQVWEFMCETEGRAEDIFCVIEKVAAMPGRGSIGSFKLGASFGFLKGCLTAAGIPYEEVVPRKWQAGIGIPKKKRNETYDKFKKRLRQHAEKLFPKEKISPATADALLISEYCRRMREGRL